LIQIITGESYQCHKQLNEIKKQYQNNKYCVFSVEEKGIKELNNIIREQDLFQSSKLILVRDWKENELKEMLKIIKDTDDEIIFYGPEIKLKSKFKDIKHLNFNIPQSQELINFIKQEFQDRNISADNFLLHSKFKIQNSKFQSLWPLMHEIEKYSLSNSSISAELWSIEDNLDPFALTNALSQNDYKKALLLVERQISQKQEPIVIVSRILWQLRVLLIVEENPKAFHTFVAQKARSSIKNFKNNEIKNLYQKAIELYENVIRKPSYLKSFYLERFFWQQISQ